LRLDDLDELAVLHAEESFWRYPFGRGLTRDETRAFVERQIERSATDPAVVMAAVERRTGELMGWMGLSVPRFLPEILPAVEVGWRLGERWWGRGLATEGGAASLRYGFEQLGLDEIVSIYQPGNVASGRVMDHLGLTLCQVTTHPEIGVALHVRSLTCERWEQQREVIAEERQRALARMVEIPRERVPDPTTVAGVDVSYLPGSRRLTAAAVLVDLASGEIVDEVVVDGEATFPYRPGLLAFREVPPLLDALERLRRRPDLVLCDGQGLAHPARCGLACHLGVVTGLAAVGCAKSRYVGDDAEPGPRRGDRAALHDGGDGDGDGDTGEVVGHVLRTQDGVRPVYVSPGHRIGFDQACEIVLATTSRFRLPDPLRRADHIPRAALRR
jgi:deoxyribonuclease V